jgi:hypothetical protein
VQNLFKASFTGMEVHSGDYSHEKLEWKAMIHILVTLINDSGLLHMVEKCYNLRSCGTGTCEELG